MSRKYDVSLVDKIKEKSYLGNYKGIDILYKPIPDVDIKGAVDPRLYKSMKKMAFMMRFIPKKMFKINEKTIKMVRKGFNKVDSTNFVLGIKEEKSTVLAQDGYEIPITIFKKPKGLTNAPILYYIHGGGFFAGNTGVVSEFIRYIVERTGIIAVSVDYRLAPEHPYPIGHNDTYAVLEWIYNNASIIGGDNSNIFVAGDSAGGNLTVYCTNRSIREHKPYVKGQIVLYPTLNMGGIKDDFTEFSFDKFDIYDKQRKTIKPGLQMFASATDGLIAVLGTEDIMNIDLTPYKEVSGNLPATMFSVGEHDTLILETLGYAKKMIDLGLKPEFTVYKGMRHAYIDHMGNYPRAEDCAIDVGDFILRISGLKNEK